MRWILSALLASLPAFAAAGAPALLTQKCAKCHGAGAQLSGLDVTSRTGLLKGGKHGPAIVPGDSAKSHLFQLVSEGKMPPGGRLDPTEVATLKSWIDAGAAMADSATSAKPKRSWWAFEAPRKTPGFESIDAFLLAKLKEKGLAYNPKADHRTLIRRLYFDLTGLPPKSEDYNQSYEAAVDKLLASPQYGERWGRHWLDVVRFGETDGGEHNYERFNAWPYRDWVIHSINADKPYTDFIREQLAGDILFPQDPKKVAATGFLVAGPWDSVSAVLNKDEALREQARYDELDDMVTTTAHSFLAMTVNCARCHDHKFDPIPTRDYYRMTAFFNAVGFGEREVGTEEARAAREAYLKPLRKQMEGIRARFSDIEDPVRARLLLAKMKDFDRQRAAEPRRIPVNPVFNRNVFQTVTAKQFRFVVTGNNGKASPKLAYVELLPAGRRIDNWTGTAAASSDQPQVLTIDLDAPAAVSEIRFASDPVRGSATGSVTVYRFEADGKEVASSMDHVNRNEVDVPSVSEEEVVAQLSADARTKREAVLAEIKAVQQQMNQAPPVSILYAAKPRDPEKSFLLERGNVRRKTEELTPGILSAIGGDLPATATSAERRLALANWIADKRNPLTARVMVNRIWQGHFGTGIVGTPSDFGINGDRPSHPELLDHLAIGFMESGWSMKWLHRQIVMTEAYRQTSAMNEKAHAVDAGNRLLWHMPLKRMDAEMLRDSMLAVTGNLSLQAGGPSYLLQKKGGGGSYIYAALNNDGPEVWRRAVYRFVVRGGERIMMDSFDCPDPSVATPQRAVSNTPVQALTMMNHEFVIKQAGLFAKRLESEAATPEARVQRAYSLLFGREATASEVARANRFLAKQSLTAFCRALFNSNEFLYVP